MIFTKTLLHTSNFLELYNEIYDNIKVKILLSQPENINKYNELLKQFIDVLIDVIRIEYKTKHYFYDEDKKALILFNTLKLKQFNFSVKYDVKIIPIKSLPELFNTLGIICSKNNNIIIDLQIFLKKTKTINEYKYIYDAEELSIDHDKKIVYMTTDGETPTNERITV